MARNKQQQAATDHVGIGEAIPAGHALTIQADKLANIGEQYSEERDLANQVLGQIEMASTFSKLLTVTTLSKLRYIKETKIYRALKGKKTRDGNEFSGTWADYCGLIGRSAESVDEDLRNLTAFGEDALESIQHIGIGYRELRQYRKLPDDQKTALIEVAKSGDKESFLDLAEEIMARSAKKDEQVVELTANYLAQSQVLASKNSLIDDQHTTIHKLKRRVETAAPDEVGADLRKEASQFSFNAEAAILGSLRPAFAALTEHGINHDLSHEEFMVGLLAQIERAVSTLRSEFALKALADGNPMPDWARDDSDEKVAAALAKLDLPDFLK